MSQETRAPTGSISLLLYNLLIMIVTGTHVHSVSFAKRQAHFLKENWDWTCHFFRKAIGIFDF